MKHNKVLLVSADQHATRRLSLTWADGAAPDLCFAAGTASALAVLQAEDVHVIVVDENLGGSDPLALLEQVALTHPSSPRIFIASSMTLEMAMRLTNQVALFRLLPKPTPTDTFAIAVDAALHSRTRQDLGRSLQAAEAPGSAPESAPRSVQDAESLLETPEGRTLSRREQEILCAVIEGRKPVEIAAAFFISVHTARNHIKSIYRKFKVHSQVELIARALSGRAGAEAARRSHMA